MSNVVALPAVKATEVAPVAEAAPKDDGCVFTAQLDDRMAIAGYADGTMAVAVNHEGTVVAVSLTNSELVNLRTLLGAFIKSTKEVSDAPAPN